MDDISEQLARRDSYLRKAAMMKTPEERLREMDALQEQAWATLRSNPEGYARFMRRNFKARSIARPNTDVEQP